MIQQEAAAVEKGAGSLQGATMQWWFRAGKGDLLTSFLVSSSLGKRKANLQQQSGEPSQKQQSERHLAGDTAQASYAYETNVKVWRPS